MDANLWHLARAFPSFNFHCRNFAKKYSVSGEILGRFREEGEVCGVGHPGVIRDYTPPHGVNKFNGQVA